MKTGFALSAPTAGRSAEGRANVPIYPLEIAGTGRFLPSAILSSSEIDRRAGIDRFGGARFTSTLLDVMRPHLLHFLTRAEGANATPYHASLEMEL